jgi:hypothetical protein
LDARCICCTEAGCLSCSTWWQMTALRHHIFGTYPQLYIARKLTLLLSLPLSTPNL